MRFAITGIVSEDVSQTIDLVANPFAEALRQFLAPVSLSCSATLIVFSPLIMPESLGAIEDESVFRTRQSAIMLSRNIDYPTWMKASTIDRLKLYAGALSAALGDLAPKCLSSEELVTLRESIAGALQIAGTDSSKAP